MKSEAQVWFDQAKEQYDDTFKSLFLWILKQFNQ